VVPDGDETRALELDASAGEKGLADQILDASPRFSIAQLAVILPQASALRRRVELPIMPESDVRSAVELQIDRLSPFKADAVRFATRVVDRDPIEGKLTADVAIAPRAAIEALEQHLGALGLKAASIDVDAGNGAGAGFDLRATDERVTPRRALLMNVGFACAAALMWYIAAVAWETGREQELEGWQAKIAELRPLAQRSAALRQQLEGLIQPFEIARAHVPAATLEVLDQVTKLMPDTVRLTELRLNGDTLELTGLAAEAPSLISKLEASKLFKDVKFRSPVTRRPELNKDRFDVSMKLEGRTR
jgi:general secretion pathway protein L